MKKRFILLIDFSEYSNNLIKYASDWSTQVNAELLLIHKTSILVPSLTNYEFRKTIANQTNNDALINLKALTKKLVPPTVKVSYLVSENSLRLTLVDLLKESFENLIFVGIKGTGFLKKLFIGSVSLKIIEKTQNIVVAMPKTISTFTHKKIYIGVSESHPLNIIELNNFLKFIDREETVITFFYFALPNENTIEIEKQLQQLAAMFADKFVTTFVIYEGQNPFEEIKKVINNKIDELLVIQKGSRYLADKLFRKFLINELVYEGENPLIVLP